MLMNVTTPHHIVVFWYNGNTIGWIYFIIILNGSSTDELLTNWNACRSQAKPSLLRALLLIFWKLRTKVVGVTETLVEPLSQLRQQFVTLKGEHDWHSQLTGVYSKPRTKYVWTMIIQIQIETVVYKHHVIGWQGSNSNTVQFQPSVHDFENFGPWEGQ